MYDAAMDLALRPHTLLALWTCGESADPATPLARALAFGQDAFGAPLLRAATDAEHEDRLVTTLDSARFRDWFRGFDATALAALAAEPSLPWPRAPDATRPQHLTQVFGDDAGLANTADHLVEATLRVLFSPSGPAVEVAGPDAFDALVSPEFPAIVGRMLVERMYAAIELLAMSSALHRSRRVVGGRSRRLLLSLVGHLTNAARLLSLLPNLQVPGTLVPVDQALDLDELRTQEATAQRRARERRPEEVAHLFEDE